MDIEEFYDFAERENFCPYYRSKESSYEAELILMPYNYLLDAKYLEN